jgi:hypothetical protein
MERSPLGSTPPLLMERSRDKREWGGQLLSDGAFTGFGRTEKGHRNDHVGQISTEDRSNNESTQSCSLLGASSIIIDPSKRPDEVKSRESSYAEHSSLSLAASPLPPTSPLTSSPSRKSMIMKRSSTPPSLPSVPSSPLPRAPSTELAGRLNRDLRPHLTASSSGSSLSSLPSKKTPLLPPLSSSKRPSMAAQTPTSSSPPSVSSSTSPAPSPSLTYQPFLPPRSPAGVKPNRPASNSSVDQSTQLAKGRSCAPGINSPRTARLAARSREEERPLSSVQSPTKGVLREKKLERLGRENWAEQQPVLEAPEGAKKKDGLDLSAHVKKGDGKEPGQSGDEGKVSVEQRMSIGAGVGLKGSIGRVQRSDSFLANLSPAKRQRLVREEVGIARKIRLWEGGRW